MKITITYPVIVGAGVGVDVGIYVELEHDSYTIDPMVVVVVVRVGNW